MHVSLTAYTPLPDTVCEEAAGTCYRSNGEKALNAAMSGGHESVLEHACFTFRIEGVSRVLLAQLTRHRLVSFSVESQRYTNTKDNPVYLPESVREYGRQLSLQSYMGTLFELYEDMLEAGVPKEDARYILPMGVTTNLVMTANARELRHIFSLRCCNRAQKEIRDLAWEMLRLCKEAAPKLFADAGPGCLRGKCPEHKSCGHPYTKKEEPQIKWSPVVEQPGKSGFYAVKAILPSGKTIQTRRFYIAESRTWYGEDGPRNDVAYWKEWQEGDKDERDLEERKALFPEANGADEDDLK